MKFAKICKSCSLYGCCDEFFKYDYDNHSCENWDASISYFNDEINNAPRFIKEKYDNDQDYSALSASFEDYRNKKAVPIHIFDAIKMKYGISMVDIAVLTEQTFDDVLFAKNFGIGETKIDIYSVALGLTPTILQNTTTYDLKEIKKCATRFWNHEYHKEQLEQMPVWKQVIAEEIVKKFQCSREQANIFSRNDNFHWNIKAKKSVLALTEIEQQFVDYLLEESELYHNMSSITYKLIGNGKLLCSSAFNN